MEWKEWAKSLCFQLWEMIVTAFVRPRLFGYGLRTQWHIPKRNDSHYAYLNVSPRPEASKVRKVLEHWYSAMPDNSKPDVRGRFRSPDYAQHFSAFTEIAINRLVRRLKYHAEVHPELPETPRHPDFLLTASNGTNCFLEVTVCTDSDPVNDGKRRLKNAVLDAVDGIVHPAFMLGVEPRGVPQGPLPQKRIRQEVERNLSSLDPLKIVADLREKGLEAMPRFQFAELGWEFEYYPIPVHRKAGKHPGRMIGLETFETRKLTASASLRDSVLRKAKRYGALSSGYVVAVNVLSDFRIDRDEICEALFGTPQYHFRADSFASSDPEFSRLPDGVWFDKGGPRYTTLSAVLIANALYPWNMPKGELLIVHNPWAVHPCRDLFPGVTAAVPIEDHLDWREGLATEELLGLPTSWPY